MLSFFTKLENMFQSFSFFSFTTRYLKQITFILPAVLVFLIAIISAPKPKLSQLIQISNGQIPPLSGISLPLDSILGWKMGFQLPATPIMQGIILFHNHLMFLVIVIVILIFGLVIGLISTYKAKLTVLPFQRTPSLSFSHASLIEILWTLFPTLILILISVPSFSLLYAIDAATTPKLTLKTIAHQWYWSYEYGDFSTKTSTISPATHIEWDSYNVSDDKILTLSKTIDSVNSSTVIPTYQRLLMTDNWLDLPSRQHIRLIVTSADVLHSWAVPAFGIKVDAVPGRLNQIYFYILRNGFFYGQCSEICGINHGFMPIVVNVVPEHIFYQKIITLTNLEISLPAQSRKAPEQHTLNYPLTQQHKQTWKQMWYEASKDFFCSDYKK